jgi:hypothetical protein
VPTPADLTALINTAGTDPDVYAVAADLAADLGDPREVRLREEAAFWGLPEPERWRWVLERVAAGAVVRLPVPHECFVTSDLLWDNKPALWVDISARGPDYGTAYRLTCNGWASAGTMRWGFRRCAPPACAPAVLAALRAALARVV